VKGDWLRVGVLVATQPEGGMNWLLGIVRRITRDRSGNAQVGIQTVSRFPVVVALHVQVGETVSIDTEPGVLLGPATGETPVEVLLRPGVHAADQNFVLERDGRKVLLVPDTVRERGFDYELISCHGVAR